MNGEHNIHIPSVSPTGAYLVLVIGLGMQVWPEIIDHVYSMKIDSGIVTCMLWALSVLSVLGLRYPLQMLPLLLFEITWKTAWCSRSLCRIGSGPNGIRTSRPRHSRFHSWSSFYRSFRGAMCLSNT